MFKPHSKLEVQDLLHAVDNRKDLLQKQLKEASEKKQNDIAEDTQYEISRMQLLHTRLAAHCEDCDYEDDVRGMFSDACTD